MAETRAHLALKQAAARFLLDAGCAAVACEVRCPFARYRIDVAGYLDSRPVAAPSAHREAAALRGTLWGASAEGIAVMNEASRRERTEPRTAIIECKQDRADFLRDGDEKDELLRLREALERRMREIEEGLIKEHEPHLRISGSYLFGEMERWDFASSRSAAYRRVLKDVRRVEERLHGHTKFWLAARYRLADRLYVLAPAGMVALRELAPAWGLIEAPEGLLRRRVIDAEALRESLVVRRVAPELGARDQNRARLLRNIAAAATRAWLPRAGFGL